VAGEAFSGDWRPTWLTGILAIGFLVVLISAPISTAFELIQLPLWGYGLIALITLIWMLLVRLMWRRRWLERWLGVEL